MLEFLLHAEDVVEACDQDFKVGLVRRIIVFFFSFQHLILVCVYAWNRQTTEFNQDCSFVG